MSTRTLRSHNGLGELSAAKFSTSSNFDVVLRSIRGVLKLDWCFYEEALEGVVRAGAHGGDVTPWLVELCRTVVVDQLIFLGFPRCNSLRTANPK